MNQLAVAKARKMPIRDLISFLCEPCAIALCTTISKKSELALCEACEKKILKK